MFRKNNLVKLFSKFNIKQYYYFKKYKEINGDKNIIRILSNELCNLTFYKNNFLENFFFNSKLNIDKIISQYLISSIYLKNLNNKAIESFTNKTILPANNVICLKLSKHISVNKILSKIFFIVFVIRNLFMGIGYFFFKIFEFLFYHLFFNINLNTSSYFISLNDPGCLSNSGNNLNVLSWFKFFEKDKNAVLFHNIKLRRTNGKTKFLASPVNILEFNTFLIFITLGTIFILITIFSLFFLRWKMPLLSKDILTSLIVRHTSLRYIFKSYFFNNTSWVFKPLWTYDAEKKGSKVYFYFISMNIENIKKNSKEINLTDNYWSICTWKNYLVWNDHHKNILQNFINFKEANIKIVDPIPFSDVSKDYLIPDFKNKKKIAIFDISPHRNFFRIRFNTELEFYKYETIKKFINDIINSDLTKNKIFYFKVKRSMNNKSYFDRRYIKFINSLSSIDNLIILPPELSAFRLAKFCDAAISLPFTSTSHIFNHENKKSIYYDPLQFFDKKHLASRGIEIMYKEDLKKFLLEI